MKTNNLEDPRLKRAVLGRPRVRVHKVIGVPINESIEYKIIQKKKELEINSHTPRYQMLFLGDWTDISLEMYKECQRLNYKNIRIL